MRVHFLYIPEIFDAVEGGIVGIVEVDGSVHCRAAKHQNIVSLYKEIGILEAKLLGVLATFVDEVAY